MGKELSKASIVVEKIPNIDISMEGVGAAPIILAEGYFGATVNNGVIKLNLYHDLLDTSNKKNLRRCVGILTLSVTNFEIFRRAINDLSESLSEQGILVVEQVKTAEKK